MFRTLQRLTFASLGFILWPLSLSGQQAAPAVTTSPVAAATEIKLTEGWVLPRGERPRGRASLPVDPIEWAYAQGSLAWPDRSADESPSADGLPAWKKVTADEQGRFDGRTIAGGWLFMTVEAPSEQVWLLEAQGHGSVRVNGAPRVGDVYANGRVEIPVLLRQGENTLIFTSGRGAVTARLRQPEKPVFFSPRDPTFPHIIRGEHEALWGGFLVVNATSSPQSGLKFKASGPGFKPTVTDVPPMPPLAFASIRRWPPPRRRGRGRVRMCQLTLSCSRPFRRPQEQPDQRMSRPCPGRFAIRPRHTCARFAVKSRAACNIMEWCRRLRVVPSMVSDLV